MKSGIIITLISLLFILLATNLYSNIIGDIGTITVYIREAKTEKLNINGKDFEVWLKNPENGQYTPKQNAITGTGFLILYHNKSYLVTAAHIARATSENLEIVFNHSFKKIDIITIKSLKEKIPGSKWFIHQKADIALHPVIIPGRFSAIPEEGYRNNSNTFSIGTKVYVLGYPLGLGLTDIVSPISKKAEICSWMTPIDNSGLKYIMLDQGLAMGYSGSPVIISPELQILDTYTSLTMGSYEPQLIGIQSQIISDETGGKLSVIVPTLYLNEILDSKEFKEYEIKNGIK